MSIFKTLLISEENLKLNSVLNDNVEMSMITPLIKYVQDTVLQPILGTKLYRDIQKEVYEEDISEKYKLLLDQYIEPVLTYGVVAEATITTAYKIFNLTFGQTSGDDIRPATLDEIKYIRQENRNRAQWYLSRLNDFLCEHGTHYPKFNESEFPDIIPTFKPYRNNIYTGRKFKGKPPAEWRYSKGGGSVSLKDLEIILDGGSAGD